MIPRFQAGTFPTGVYPRLEVRARIVWILFSAALVAGDLPASKAGTASSAARMAPAPAILATVGTGTAVPPAPMPLSPTITALPDITNPPVPPAAMSPKDVSTSVSNSVPSDIFGFFAETNGLPRNAMSREEWLAHLTHQYEMARYLRTTRQPRDAEPMLIDLLRDTSPDLIKQSALLELAASVQDENDLTRAQQIYAQFLGKWPNDLRVPEILLRQGLLFRQMGLYQLAFTKFYAVMTSALVLKNDQLDFYVRLVLQAQTEIAETRYELGEYAYAADFFSRLLKQNNPAINRSQILYKLARCHAALGKNAEAVSDAQEFLLNYPDAPEQPEIRFHLALALKQIGRNGESLQQVLLLLREQRALTKDHPEIWAYWQQRAGNLIANQLYREGDYARALEIYLNLARLDSSPLWQLPVNYQIGMTYERLWQPQKATEIYTGILSHEKELGTNAPPSLKTVFDMAQWRVQFIQWQNQAEAANHQLHVAAPNNTAATASLPAPPVAIP